MEDQVITIDGLKYFSPFTPFTATELELLANWTKHFTQLGIRTYQKKKAKNTVLWVSVDDHKRQLGRSFQW